MKKQLTVLILFSISFTFFSQEKRRLKTGKVILEHYPISDVHILNKNTNIGTISNEKGFFEIPIKDGDSLYFSHINLQEKLVIISKAIISKDNFIIQLTEKTYSLDEIIIEKSRSIFYVDPEIKPNNAPIVNAKTLRLPYANSVVKKDNSIFKIRSGGILSIDNLINSLNGNNRRKKLLQKMANEDTELSKIRKQFTDDFFVTDLKIKKEYINQFLNDCIDKNIIAIFKGKKNLKLTKVLLKESKEFPYKIENEDLFLTKN